MTTRDTEVGDTEMQDALDCLALVAIETFEGFSRRGIL